MTCCDVALLTELRKFDTPTICNAIELFEVRPRHAGYADSRLRCAPSDSTPAVGVACTATFRSGSRYEGTAIYGQVEKLFGELEAAHLPSIVACEDLDDPPAGATFGEVMCRSYQGLGATGLVTSGAGRDLPQIQKLGFPVWFGSTLPSHAYCHAVEVGVPVTICGLRIAPGDIVHADVNGVTTIPLEIVREVPDVAVEYLQCEAVVLEAGAGEFATAGELISRRREMIDRIAALRRKVVRGPAI